VPQGTVLAPVAASMVFEVAARGLSPAPLLDRLGLDASSARDPERRVPFGALFDVWAECMRVLRDPGLPIAAAQRIRLEEYTVLGFATTAAPTFRAALGIVARYIGVVAEGCRFTVIDDPAHPGIRLGWEREGERSLGHRVANECAIAEAMHVARQILGARIAPLGVAFRHAAPASIAAHVAFFEVRPRFGSSWEGLELPREVLDRIPKQANPPLAAWLERQMASALAARVAPATFAERVGQLVEQDLASGEPDLGRVARALGLSERSLRRHLQKDELSFRAIGESARRRRAESLLRAGHVTIDEVAFLTGYSETSAFARAFKRWSGETPGLFRRRSLEEQGRNGQEAGRSGQGS
jgi:AraC-like DNA-binding protein